MEKKNILIDIKNILLDYEIKFIFILIALLLLLVVIEVILRFLKLPLYWSEEASRYIFFWMVMLAVAIGIEKKTHFHVDIIDRFINKKYRKLLYILSNIVIMLFVIVLFYEGIKFCIYSKGAVSPSFGMPMYYVYLIIPVAALLMLFHLFIQIYKSLLF